MSHSYHGDLGTNHLYDTVYVSGDPDSGKPGSYEMVGQFDWEQIDRNVDGIEPEERVISFADASAAIAILAGWMCQSCREEPAPIRTVAAKCEALLFWLDPNQSKYKSLSDIADACQITRAAVSKMLLGLKDQLGSAVSVGKGSHTRETYRQVQRNLAIEGKHASEKTRGVSKKRAS